jgi:hypothetical protein
MYFTADFEQAAVIVSQSNNTQISDTSNQQQAPVSIGVVENRA